ncbi:uncharacterized protein Bfra_002153 [Botrytis fragariae]|uniref:Uncharacterized protein n=1 Tax=Botrytis fragariae TaxID=1964551 RepID=A0A8H6EMH2_9HELO|nr:uncharacterized protein Bfra_002153 [Botrytis fragariae]KAF5877786.1 hypothetical protein Bfra_002153 [Botrytis fragariae]
MTGFHWTHRADALFIWVAGGVWRHENRIREGKFMITQKHLFDRVGDFLDALNKFEPFDKGRDDFNMESIRMHVYNKKIHWKQPQWVERPPWLSEDALKGQFGEVGLEALHESTSRLRHTAGSDTAEWRERVQNGERTLQDQEILAAQGKKLPGRRTKARPQKREQGKAQAPDEAQKIRFWREQEEKIREQEFRRGVKKLGYTKDAESSGDLSWTDPNASGFHYQNPEPDSYGGAFRPGVKDGYLTPPLRLKTTSTVRR